MELLRLIDSRIGRWLAYADSCLNAAGEVARCQSFWFLITAVLAAICVVVLVIVITKMLLEKRKGAALPGHKRYQRPS